MATKRIVVGPVIRDPVVIGPVIDKPIVNGPVINGPVIPGPILDGPIVIGPQIPPLFRPKLNVNLFDGMRPGRPVVRPDDLLALRIETVGLTVTPQPQGTPRLSRSSPTGDAFLVLHFPPQAIAEQVFYEVADEVPQEKDAHLPPAQVVAKGNSENDIAPPVNARIAEESRVAFAVPPGFEIDYTLHAVLAACETLALNVAANAVARPPIDFTPVFPGGGLVFVDKTVLDGSIAKARITGSLKTAVKVPTTRAAIARAQATAIATRTALAAVDTQLAIDRSSRAVATLRQLRIALSEGADSPTLALRAAAGNKATMDLAFNASDLVTVRPGLDIDIGPILRIKPKPAAPGATTTSIELPWRLILSPHSAERFAHATGPVTSPVSARTELWHSRLVTLDGKGVPVDYPAKDAARTVRAIWARGGEHPSVPMQSAFPSNVLTMLPPSPGLSPFRQTLDDSDRYQIVHLSSNFAFPGYVPQAVQVNSLMLSALGGWLDSRGAWEPPGLSVEEWTHRASMARDHYVRVVYKGLLFPFGHRVSLVKVTERKFHNGQNGKPALAGNAAVLRQRMYIVVRERERVFADTALRTTAGGSMSLQFPFSRVAITTVTTPSIDPVGSPPSIIGTHGQRMFWPCVGGAPFRFHCVATDLDGRRIDFELPMIFMDNTYASPRTSANKPDFAAAQSFALLAQSQFKTRENRRTTDLRGQRVAMAASLKAGDTACEAMSLEFGSEAAVQGEAANKAGSLTQYSNQLKAPVFYPSVVSVTGRVPALAQLAGSSASNTLRFNQRYLQNGFTGNKGEVFADVDQTSVMAKLDFSGQGDRSGGFVMPNIKPAALSRLNGPISGDAAAVSKYMDGVFEPTSFFPGSLSDLPLPLLFGCIPLGAVIGAVADLAGAPDKVPKFVAEAADKAEALVNDLVRLVDFVRNLGSNAGGIADAAVAAAKAMLDDLLKQALTMADAQVAPLRTAIE
ncbi:MAG: hypothetical protein JWQ11_4707, partial [Rhizobacter sp.]|nr:hypothetical protein [Rhizobacter sp.]